MSTQHEIIRAWCASCGMPAPSEGDCIALTAALTHPGSTTLSLIAFIVDEWKENGEVNGDAAMCRIDDALSKDEGAAS